MQIHQKPYLQDYGGGATYRTLGEGLHTGLWGRDYLQDNDGGETYRTVAKGYLKNYGEGATYWTRSNRDNCINKAPTTAWVKIHKAWKLGA